MKVQNNNKILFKLTKSTTENGITSRTYRQFYDVFEFDKTFFDTKLDQTFLQTS